MSQSRAPGYFADTVEEAEDRDVDELDDYELSETDAEPAPAAGSATASSASAEMQAYFADLERRMRVEYDIARQCRALGLDPEVDVEVPPAIDLAARVEELLVEYIPQRGIAARIRELAIEHKHNRELLSLLVAKEVAAGRFGAYPSKEDALDGAIRAGLAILTEGILVAPLEGIAGVRVLHNDDGTDCVAVSYAGPIRAAGGTGQALSVLIGDVVRRELGIGKYVPTRQEIERYKEEIPAYKMAQHLQYTPTNDEIELIARSCPVMIDGEGTEDEEVGGNRDLPRVETNNLRGGACLVMAEGMILKAAKIQKHVKALGLDGWQFIDQFLNKGKETEKDAGAAVGGRPAIEPNPKYMLELVAGRPVFSHPSHKGGWRLRYGRARTGGLATLAISPATMVITDDFLAIGTQMKIERPGKATVATPCDGLEGPIVLTFAGALVQVDTVAEARAIAPKVRKIVDLGEILVPFGEFVENNKTLPQSPWVDEWWAKVVERATGAPPPPLADASAAFALAERTQTPLAPRWNLFWHDITTDDIARLSHFVEDHGRYDAARSTLRLPRALAESPGGEGPRPALSPKDLLVELGALHEVDEDVLLLARYGAALVRCLGLEVRGDRLARRASLDSLPLDPCDAVSRLAGVRIMPRAPFRIGTRMGRPEKAAERKMAPPVHALFPIGLAGGAQRQVRDAAKLGAVEVEVGERVCPLCGEKTLALRCPTCGPVRGGAAHTRVVPTANGRATPHKLRIDDALAKATTDLKIDRLPESLKGVQGLISNAKTPEPLEKGVLRALHDVFTFKDGTIRFDMTDVTLTHFRPREIHTSVARLRELGYTADVRGASLERDDQILELRVQDIVVSSSCLDYMFRASQYVDDELRRFYGLKPYYNAKAREDLVGHLFVALAPHTSGGVLSRIIGHTKAQVHFGHPYFHAAKRRNCVHPDTELLVERDGAVERVRMGTWVDARFESARQPRRILDAHGTEKVAIAPGLRVASLDPVTREPRLIAVTSAVRGWTESWIRIVTDSGREFLCTPDHVILHDEAGSLQTKPAEKVVEGDRLPLAATLPFPTAALPEVDLARSFAAFPLARDIIVKGVTERLRALVKGVGRDRVARAAGLDADRSRNVGRWCHGPRLSEFAALVGHGLVRWEELPVNARLAPRARAKALPVRLALAAPQARLLGRYLACGRVRASARGGEVTFTARDDADAREIVADIAAALGAEASVDGRKVTLVHPLAPLLFTRVWSAERDREISLPGFAFSLPHEQAAALLDGFFASVDRSANGTYDARVPSLRSDIATLLLRLGVPAAYVGEAGLAAKVPAAGFGVSTAPARAAALDRVASVERIDAPGHTYCLDVASGSTDVATKNVLWANQLYQVRCDGDEDCVMLLLDGLLNFSRSYLPSSRGGLMDAPLTLTMRIDPREVDKEAGNVDVAWTYPVEFYEATTKHPQPKEVEKLVELASKRFGTPGQYQGLGFTHDTADIAEGPDASAYKTIGSMMEKMEAQLSLALKLRAVDAPDVAARVIGSHFLPDLRGNLTKFSKQSVRCTKCGAKFRRIPLSGKCIKNGCGGNLTLTVYEASVKKYLEVSKEICARYGVNDYVRQRLEHIEDSIDSLFTNDRVKKAKLTDFF
ncbi:MAG: DNA polymerase II large subunit [Thermoplasmatota archaeon]